MSRKATPWMLRRRTICHALLLCAILQGCVSSTNYVPPVFDGGTEIRNLVVCVEGEPPFEVYDKRYEFHWYDMFISFGRYARDQVVKDKVDPDRLFSPQEIFTTELIRAIQTRHRFGQVYLAAQSKDISPPSGFDALLVLNVKEWGMVGTKQEKDTLIPYLLMDLRMTSLKDGRVLWKEQFRLRSTQREYIENYADDKELLRRDLVAMASRTGNRIALLLGESKTTRTPEEIDRYAALPASPSSQFGDRNTQTGKALQEAPGNLHGEVHFSRIPDGRMLPDDIRRLFADKTVRGFDHKKEVEFIFYFGADGSLLRKKTGQKRMRTGRWSTDASGLCVSYDHSDLKCFVLLKEKGVINQYPAKSAGKGKIGITFSGFRKGEDKSLLADDRKKYGKQKKHPAQN